MTTRRASGSSELFGEPGRWATTARRMVWSTESVLVQAFTGSTSVEVPVLCNYDLELAATRYFSVAARRRGPARLALQRQRLLPGARTSALQIAPIPWDTVADYQMPVEAWRAMIDAHYPHRGWVALDAGTVERLGRLKGARATTRSTRRSASCSTRPSARARSGQAGDA